MFLQAIVFEAICSENCIPYKKKWVYQHHHEFRKYWLDFQSFVMSNVSKKERFFNIFVDRVSNYRNSFLISKFKRDIIIFWIKKT